MMLAQRRKEIRLKEAEAISSSALLISVKPLILIPYLPPFHRGAAGVRVRACERGHACWCVHMCMSICVWVKWMILSLTS